MPGTSGRMWENSTERTVWALSSAITSWKRVKRSYGTPPPFSKHETMSSSTAERLVIHCASTARLSGEAARVSQAACSAGRENRAVFGIDLHDAPGRHRAEPLTDVPLVELGRVGELLARSLLVLREGVEQARAVAHGNHHRQRAAVQQFEHATREGFGALGVVRSLGHLHLLGPGL